MNTKRVVKPGRVSKTAIEKKARRRTQAERRAATRRALVEAAIASVVDAGVAGAAVDSVARRAGATSGAVQHHFGGRDGLLFAVVDDFGVRLDEVSRSPVPEGITIANRVAMITDMYWELVSSPHYLAVVQILVATKQDQALHGRIFKRLARFESELDRHWVRIFAGCGIPSQRVAVLRHIVMGTFRGLSLRMLYRGDRSHWALERDVLREMLVAALSPAKKRARKAPAPRA